MQDYFGSPRIRREPCFTALSRTPTQFSSPTGSSIWVFQRRRSGSWRDVSHCRTATWPSHRRARMWRPATPVARSPCSPAATTGPRRGSGRRHMRIWAIRPRRQRSSPHRGCGGGGAPGVAHRRPPVHPGLRGTEEQRALLSTLTPFGVPAEDDAAPQSVADALSGADPGPLGSSRGCAPHGGRGGGGRHNGATSGIGAMDGRACARPSRAGRTDPQRRAGPWSASAREGRNRPDVPCAHAPPIPPVPRRCPDRPHPRRNSVHRGSEPRIGWTWPDRGYLP